jgi:hypothetical protein
MSQHGLSFQRAAARFGRWFPLQPCRAGLIMLAIVLTPTNAFAQLRVVNYNIAQLIGNEGALENVLASLQDDNVPGFAVPVSMFVFQEVRNADFVPLLNLVNATAPPGITYNGATYTNINEDGTGGAQAMFYRADLLDEFENGHADIYTQAGRYTDRWRMRLIDYPSISAWFWLYSSHLKSDTGAANQNLRLLGAQAIRSDADALGVNQNIIYLGDLNLYNNFEPAYLHFLSAGNGQAFDPLGTDSWAGLANAYKHSQSPRLDTAGGLVGGGLDDRFDFQLCNTGFNDGEGLSLMSNVYRSVGNDGMHFDQAINNGNNFYYPGNVAASNILADWLHEASDHVPLIVEYQLPAVMMGSMASNYGRVIQNSEFAVQVDVTNEAEVQVADGADELDYTATGSLGFSGVFADTVSALGDVSSSLFPLNTSVVGVRNGRVTLTSASQAVKNPTIILDTTGTIVRPSNPSFSNSADINEINVPFKFEADTGVQSLTVDVFNLGYDPLQALLDIDSITAVTMPFSFVGGLENNIGRWAGQLTFGFDTTALATGNYNASVIINTSDENIPGQAASQLNLTLSVAMGEAQMCVADVTGNGLVDVDDLLIIINAWGACANPKDCPADVTANGAVDVDDLLTIINAWGVCQ